MPYIYIMNDATFGVDDAEQAPIKKARTIKFTIVCESMAELSHLKHVFKTNERRIVYHAAVDAIGQSLAKSPEITPEENITGFGSSL